MVEQIPVGFAVGTNVAFNRRRALQHAHRIARGGEAVHFNVFWLRIEERLLGGAREAALFSDGKAGGGLNAVRADLAHEARGVAARKDAARGNHGNGEVLFRKIRLHFPHNGFERMILPVFHAEAQVSAGKRPLDHDVVGETPRCSALSEEKIEGARGGDDDAEKRIVKALVFRHQAEAREVQARRERDAVDARVKRCIETGFEGIEPGIHRELFHAVDEHEPASGGFRHDVRDVADGRFANGVEVKEFSGFVCRISEAGVALRLGGGEARAEKAVGDIHQHGVRQMRDAAELFDGETQLGRGNIRAHAAHDEGRIVSAAQRQSVGAE